MFQTVRVSVSVCKDDMLLGLDGRQMKPRHSVRDTKLGQVLTRAVITMIHDSVRIINAGSMTV